jgi:hypothetical protein
MTNHINQKLLDDMSFLQEIVLQMGENAYCNDEGICAGCVWIHAVQDAAEKQGIDVDEVWED